MLTLRRLGTVGARKAIIVGCGVSGLSSAIRLLEAGLRVELWTRDLPPRTTSSVAGAIWYPFKAAPPESVARWSRESYFEYERLARTPDSGVTMRRGIEILPPGQPDESAEIRAVARGLRPLGRAELPQGFDRGFEYAAPVIEMPIFLDWALRRVEALGGSVRERTLASFDEALAECALVVNCTGLASRELAGDREVVALRGQVVRVERAGIDRFVLDDFDPRGLTYVFPRSRDCVLGGTVEPGREELVPDEAATVAIVARCKSLAPELADARVLSVAVGLRPGRSAVRLERVSPAPGQTLIHNYGHGGAGVTLAWGCAADVQSLAT